jgi:hypothetical protein
MRSEETVEEVDDAAAIASDVAAPGSVGGLEIIASVPEDRVEVDFCDGVQVFVDAIKQECDELHRVLLLPFAELRREIADGRPQIRRPDNTIVPFPHLPQKAGKRPRNFAVCAQRVLPLGRQLRLPIS